MLLLIQKSMRFWALLYFIGLTFLTNYWIKNLWPLIYNWSHQILHTQTYIILHNRSSHTAQIIEDIHAKCNVFYILDYKTLTAYVQIFCLFWVLFPIHSLTLSICICLILGQFFSQILVCTTTNICLHAIGRLMFLVKCE